MHEQNIGIPERDEVVVPGGEDAELTIHPAVMVFTIFVNGPRIFLEAEGGATPTEPPESSDNS